MHLLERECSPARSYCEAAMYLFLLMVRTHTTCKLFSIPYLGHLALVHILKVCIQWPFSHHLQQSPQCLTASLTHLRIGVVQFLAVRTVGEMVQ